MNQGVLVRGGTPTGNNWPRAPLRYGNRFSATGLLLPQYDLVREYQRIRGPISPLIVDEVMVGHRFFKDDLSALLANGGNRRLEGILKDLGFDIERFEDIQKEDDGDTVYYYQGYPKGDRPHD